MRSLWGRRQGAEKVELMDNGYGGKPLSSTAPNAFSPPPGAITLGFAPAPATPDPSFHKRNKFTMFRAKNFNGLARFKLPKGALKLYIDDLYHTLLNMPRYRFLASFFCVYLTLYLFFSFFYLAIKEECIGLEMTFPHAFWFSVWTASTIGYSGDMAPSPDCTSVNMLVMIQLIVAALIDTMLMSLVFSRFAAPMPRARTIRFSTNAVLARPAGSRYWTLSFRLANIRKHALMEPQVVLLLAMPSEEHVGTAAMKFVTLSLHDELSLTTCMKLGLPVTVSHVIDPNSPLYDLSLTHMEEHGMEFLCFMSGLDPMTSNMVQAHHSYRPLDVRMNEQFVAIHISTNRMGRLGVDLSVLDHTAVAEVGGVARDESRQVLYPVPTDAEGSREGMRQHMEELRTRTFRDLSQEDPSTRGAAAAAAAARRDQGAIDDSDHSGAGLYAAAPFGAIGGASASAPQVAVTGWASHPLAGVAEDAAAPPLPLSRSPLETQGSMGAQGVQPWDAAVRALCDAVGSDASASPAVRQQAALLRAAIVAPPAAMHRSGNGQFSPSQQPGGKRPSIDSLLH